MRTNESHSGSVSPGRPLVQSSAVAVAVLCAFLASGDSSLRAEPAPAKIVCAVFHDWKDHIPFWPDPKIHARQGGIPTGEEGQWQHVQSSFWETTGGNGAEDFSSSHDDAERSHSTIEQGDLKFDPSVESEFDLFHTDWADGYAVDHETTPCLGPESN